MKRLALALTLAFVALSAQDAFAQDQVVTGQVTAAAGERPLPGVSVQVKNTDIGTITNDQGRYRLTVPETAEILVFSSIGYRTVEIPIPDGEGAAVVNATLEAEAIALEGIVVTALGETMTERSITTSIQEIEGDEIAAVPETNIINSLHGKIAGVKITDTGGQLGGSSRIVIRGVSSITGSNQPLFVVNGTPIISSDVGFMSGYGGVDWGGTVSGINPNNIKSITVLKGAAAAALYGSRAANGVILIETKDGSGVSGTRVTASTDMMWSEPLVLPNYQNMYGQGIAGRFKYVNGLGGGVFDGTDQSWGPKLDVGKCIPQWFSPVTNGVRQCSPWRSSPNNVRNYLQTGVLRRSNFTFATSGDGKHLRLSIGNTAQSGIMPGSELDQTTINLAGGADLSERLRVDASASYIKRDALNLTSTGYDGDNPFLQFIWFGRQVSTERLRNGGGAGSFVTYNDAGVPIHHNWNYNYHSNPWWIQLKNTSWQHRDRLFGNVQVAYDLADWLTAEAQVGTDFYTETRQINFAINSIGAGIGGGCPNGCFLERDIYRQETNYQLLLKADRGIGDAISISATAGAEYRTRDYRVGETFVGQLASPGGIFTVQNAAVTPQVETFRSEEAVASVLGSVQLGYNNYAFLRVTGRNDWSSTLPADSRSYFYPSVSGSFIFTDAFGIESDILSYGKVRASWAQVGNDARPYQLSAVYPATNSWGGITAYEVYDEIPNANLLPEQTNEWEVGTSLGFFNNRLNIDATYYHRNSFNQVLTAPIPPASGFSTQVLNGGEIRNTGIELLVNASPIRTDDFRWDVTVNYANNNSYVVSLGGGLDRYILPPYGYWGLQAVVAPGRPAGVFYGSAFKRNEDGEIVINAAGFPVQADSLKYLGQIDPEWTAGLGSHLSYGNFDFSFLFDAQMGGNVFSVTNMFGAYTGVLQKTLMGRQIKPATNPALSNCKPGVELDELLRKRGFDKVEDTEKKVCPIQLRLYHYLINEWDIYDASFVKLREVRLGWSVPTSLLGPLPISSLDIALIGRNLWISKNVPNIDPETAFGTDNRRGFEFGQIPTQRSIGFSVSVTP